MCRVRVHSTEGRLTVRVLSTEGIRTRRRQLEGRRGLEQPHVSTVPGDPLVDERAIHGARGKGDRKPGAGAVECAVHGVERRPVGVAGEDDGANSGEAALHREHVGTGQRLRWRRLVELLVEATDVGGARRHDARDHERTAVRPAAAVSRD